MNRSLRMSVSLAAALCACMPVVFSSPASAFDIVNRWSATQVNGGNLQRGQPVTLRWSIVPDGKSYSRSNNSQLVQFLDDAWNVAAAQRVATFQNRPWFTVMNNAYAQYGRVAGFTMQYVAEQTAAGVSTGNVGDIRIGGENLDGTPGGALADNTFPNDGDMRIDTTREANGSIGFYFSTEPGLRNLVIHESGHGVGLGHTDFVNNSAKAVMEGGLRTDIWGFQFDDVYALNRQYGDPREKTGGDTPATALQAGVRPVPSTLSLGLDATDSVVEQFDDDWLGIDGINDVDYFKFSATGESFASIRVTPIGPTYQTTQQGVFNAAAQNDLVLRAFVLDGQVLQTIATIDLGGIGAAEQLGALHIAVGSEYMIRINGKQDANQFYRLDLSTTALPGVGMSADINLDNVTDLADWSQFLESGYTVLDGLTGLEAFKKGDLDFDGDNDFADFRLFKSAFDLANGAGAFASLTGVPEPAGLVMLTAVGAGLAALRPRRRA